MTYAVKEIFYTLQGEGARPGGRRCSAALPAAICGPGARRTGPRRSARSATPISSAWTAPRAAGSPMPATLADRSRRCGRTGRPARFVVCTGGEPLLQLDPPLIDGAARPRLRDRDRDQRHDRAAAGHRLDLRQPEGRAPSCWSASGDELKLVVPQAGARPARLRRARLPPLLAAADGRPGPRQQHRMGDRLLPRPPAMAAQPADAQDDRDTVTEVLRRYPGAGLSRPVVRRGPAWRTRTGIGHDQPQPLERFVRVLDVAERGERDFVRRVQCDA